MADNVKEKEKRRKQWLKNLRAFHKTRRGTSQSAETQAKRSASLKRYYSIQANRDRQSKIVSEAVKHIPLKQRLASNKKRSESHKGMSKPWNGTYEKRKAQSKQLKADYASGKRQVVSGLGYGRISRYISPRGKVIIMRSTWELAFAYWLDAHRIKWKYEPTYFQLKCGCYLPDFHLTKSNIWIEIKGLFSKKAKIKMKQFFKTFPEERLYILRNKDLHSLGVLKKGAPVWQTM